MKREPETNNGASWNKEGKVPGHVGRSLRSKSRRVLYIHKHVTHLSTSKSSGVNGVPHHRARYHVHTHRKEITSILHRASLRVCSYTRGYKHSC